MRENTDTSAPTPGNPIVEMLVANLMMVFEPIDEPDENSELFATIEIMDEMRRIADVEKWQVVTALQKAGFKTVYNDAGFFWVLRRK